MAWGLWATTTQAGVSIESRAEPTTIRIGDVVRYTIAVSHDAATEVQLPGPGENLGAFEIRDFTLFKPRKVGGLIREEAEYLISTYDVGEFVIPPVRVLYRSRGDTSWQELWSQPISIQVASLNPDLHGDIRDIKPPLSVPYDWRRLIVGILVALLFFGAAGAGVYLYWRHRRGLKLLPTREAPPRPAHEIALEELDALFHSDLLERGEVKLLHIRLSEIVRRYLEGRYEVRALEMTTQEILEAFGDDRLPVGVRELLAEFLSACDLVKFAKYHPGREEIEHTFHLAYQFVESTKPAVSEMVPSTGSGEEPLTGSGSAQPAEGS